MAIIIKSERTNIICIHIQAQSCSFNTVALLAYSAILLCFYTCIAASGKTPRSSNTDASGWEVRLATIQCVSI